MHMVDQGEIDDKILAVAKNDASLNKIDDIGVILYSKFLKDIPEHILQQIQRFFEDYKKLEKKSVIVEEFKDKAAAFTIIQESIKLYEDKFLTNLTVEWFRY